MIKQNPKNMRECDKRKSHTSSKIHMIYISSNNVRHPVTKTFATLHYITPSYTSLHFTTLTDTSLPEGQHKPRSCSHQNHCVTSAIPQPD